MEIAVMVYASALLAGEVRTAPPLTRLRVMQSCKTSSRGGWATQAQGAQTIAPAVACALRDSVIAAVAQKVQLAQRPADEASPAVMRTGYKQTRAFLHTSDPTMRPLTHTSFSALGRRQAPQTASCRQL